MALNLLDSLESDGEFRSAVFLTYTLSLQYFEQLVAPRLDGAGCTNVLIFADTAGYDEALMRGARSLSGAGTRYVCARLRSAGYGVQHAKLVLLAGPDSGRLLVGSGNLTMQGFGRNLELFDRYDIKFDEQNDVDAQALYPFHAAWQLIRRIYEHDSSLPSSVANQLQNIVRTSPWLERAAPAPADLQLWHNFDQPLLDRIAQLDATKELQIIAPFFDLSVIQSLCERLQPQRLMIGVDAFHPNLDGAALVQYCRTQGYELAVRALDGQSARRPLHAKAIVGITAAGAWCMSGSANCTRPALLRSWSRDGNLELVTWRRASDPTAFDAVWRDEEICVQERDPAALCDTSRPDEEERPARLSLDLLELSYQEQTIRGRLRAGYSVPANATYALELLRGYAQIAFNLHSDNTFSVSLQRPLQSTEAARVSVLVNGDVWTSSSYMWIDQPAELARYAQRAYYIHLQEGIKTFDGAGKLFEELMNFLLQRVDPRTYGEASGEISAFRVRAHHTTTQLEDDSPPPPPSAFIVDDDLVHTISRRVAGSVGYERSTLSLQDLLSLVLLRLTIRTVPGTADVAQGASPDIERETVELADHEDRQRAAQERLRTYLMRYCRNYAERLGNPDFVTAAGAERLFENHAILGRILLEVADKCGTELTPDAVFSRTDFRRCARLMLSGMFWRAGANLDGDSAWHILIANGETPANLKATSIATDMIAVMSELIARAWGEPPSWKRGMNDPALVQEYLCVQEMLRQLQGLLGTQYWQLLADASVNVLSLFGFRRVADVELNRRPSHSFDVTIARLDRLAAYRTPMEEHYAPLITWWSSSQRSLLPPPDIAATFASEVALLKQRPTARFAPLDDDEVFCPQCRMRLAQRVVTRVQRGGVDLCDNCRRVALYWKPVLKL